MIFMDLVDEMVTEIGSMWSVSMPQIMPFFLADCVLLKPPLQTIPNIPNHPKPQTRQS